MKFIAYYRVSTERQRVSGLGLEAQREAVARHIGSADLLAEYTETESGKHHANRPQLLAALAECRKQHATLLIARLDRLARNVAFIAGLMESGVDFVACDMPLANKLTIHILAAVAEHEALLISQRTKAALAAAKAQGIRLGNPRIAAAREQARLSHRAHRPAAEILNLLREWRDKGISYRQMAERLNHLNIRPARGRAWYGSSVRNQIKEAA